MNVFTDEMIEDSIEDLEADLYVGELIEFGHKLAEVSTKDLLTLFAGYGAVLAGIGVSAVNVDAVMERMDAIYLEIQLRMAIGEF